MEVTDSGNSGGGGGGGGRVHGVVWWLSDGGSG